MIKVPALVIASMFFFAGSVSAQMTNSAPVYDEQRTQSLQDPAISAALQLIYTSQSVAELKNVDCSKVSEEQLIKLGDAVMGYGITEAEHTAKENMMGGEESPMSKRAHENMGRAYLGCWAGYRSGPMAMPMMSSAVNTAPPVLPGNDAYTSGSRGFMNGGLGLGGGMMGGSGSFGGLTMLLVWIFLILGIAALVKMILKK